MVAWMDPVDWKADAMAGGRWLMIVVIVMRVGRVGGSQSKVEGRKVHSTHLWRGPAVL